MIWAQFAIIKTYEYVDTIVLICWTIRFQRIRGIFWYAWQLIRLSVKCSIFVNLQLWSFPLEPDQNYNNYFEMQTMIPFKSTSKCSIIHETLISFIYTSSQNNHCITDIGRVKIKSKFDYNTREYISKIIRLINDRMIIVSEIMEILW